MTTVIIDGDPIAWKAANYAKSVSDAHGDAVRAVDKIVTALSADRVIICLSDSSRRYFRHDIYPDYKKDRPDHPLYMADARAALKCVGYIRELPSLEADDVMGILGTTPSMKGEIILAATDKDLMTIPGVHYHTKRKERFTISEAQAGCTHLQQTLEGDTGEFKGCPRIGEVKSKEIVTLEMYTASPADAWAAVVAAFAEKNLTEADAIVQARLARILRACDFDLATKTIIPWMPPKPAPPPVAQSLFEGSTVAAWAK